MTSDNERLGRAIRACLEALVDEAMGNGSHPGWDDTRFRSNREWTRELKTRLCQLGCNLGYTAYAHGVEDVGPGEWLYDVVWLDYDSEGQLRGISLVAESEWGNLGDIKDDFEKLVQCRADFRVMVFQARNSKAVVEQFAQLSKLKELFSSSLANDRYLLCGYDNNGNNFLFHSLPGGVALT